MAPLLEICIEKNLSFFLKLRKKSLTVAAKIGISLRKNKWIPSHSTAMQFELNQGLQSEENKFTSGMEHAVRMTPHWLIGARNNKELLNVNTCVCVCVCVCVEYAYECVGQVTNQQNIQKKYDKKTQETGSRILKCPTMSI